MAKLGITQNLVHTAWQRFNVHWMAGLGIVFISVLLDFIPVRPICI
ncbi:MAG: hypothetical protein KatS3mg025_0001 [Bacteroidia bacterium]|nr:MAG: hypothetical protein KatS3mg025_0001 [Bacteroidia bacterium]